MPDPQFIDNLDGNTLARALVQALEGVSTMGDAQEEAVDPPKEVRVATAFFSPAGFAHIADYLKPVPTVRLMLGADMAAVQQTEPRNLVESESAFKSRRLRDGLNRMEKKLRWDRDRLPFTRSSKAALQKLVATLRFGNMEVRRYEQAFLHAKTYIFAYANADDGGADRIIAGSSNLTDAGLTRNLELNLGHSDGRVAEQARQWFDSLWESAEPYNLATVFEETLRPRTPWEIYIRVLWQLYGNEVEKEVESDRNLPLTNFQKHGVARALRLIRETGGAIVADEVGLGKTFVAGEVLADYGARRQRALVVCPASLRDSTWKQFLHRFQIYVECLSFEELANHIHDPNRGHLRESLEHYQLVIVDEAHNYRNPNTRNRALVLEKLLSGQRRDVLFLTATPVNNSLWDLYNLIRYFVRQDAQFANKGIVSIRQRFVAAMREDPTDLSPDLLYPIIDATTVKRTRQFVRKHYSGDQIPSPSGTLVPIEFPEPQAISVRYQLDEVLPGVFDHLEEALDPESQAAISFSRYMPVLYLRTGAEPEDRARARAIVGLLRSGLLKRFESSVYAFRKTVEKMVREHEAFLRALDDGFVVTSAFMKEISAEDDDIFEEVLVGTEHRTSVYDYESERLRGDVQCDIEKLQSLLRSTSRVLPEQDPKLIALANALTDISRQASSEGIDQADERNKRKVLVFSFFEDTIRWIRDFLHAEFDRNPDLEHYCDRMVLVSGSGNIDDHSRHIALEGFAPVSMEVAKDRREDRFDVLVSTDVLAEGVNLQQCRHIINYDMPWNPMRLVQRHGRIDRINSQHSRVFLRTIFPADRLDRLLNLEQRILDKLAMAAGSVGVEAPIEGAARGRQVFMETREEIEKLMREEPDLYVRGATESAAQSSEEYRQALRKAVEAGSRHIVNLPWKVGSGMVRGARRGVFFCAVVGKRTFLRFVPADEKWNVVDREGVVERELGTCLRLIECEEDTGVHLPDALEERVFEFWDVAQKDIHSEWMWNTDPINLQPKVKPLNRRVAEYIRAHPPRNVDSARTDAAIDVLESPWPRRQEVELREWQETLCVPGAADSEVLVEKILATGLQAAGAPDPLPPVRRDDIELLCWMGIEPAAFPNQAAPLGRTKPMQAADAGTC